jgi:hypothetical protein
MNFGVSTVMFGHKKGLKIQPFFNLDSKLQII